MHSQISLSLATLLLTSAICPAEEPIISPDAGRPVIDWRKAAKYLGRDVIVQGKIMETKNIGRICFLNFDRDRSFTAIIREPSYVNFPSPVEDMYLGKIVRIRGSISEYRGRPQIEFFHPDQVRILDKEEPIPPAAPPPSHEFTGIATIASYNVLNLFDEHDDPYHSDEGTRPKPKQQLENLAKTIRKANADVVALQEVENRGYLEIFNRAMLSDMGYKHVVCFEGNDRRGIDCAVLSRLPVGPVTSHRHLEFSDGCGGTLRFRRDLLQVRILPPGGLAFDIFVVHLKSKRGGSSTRRIRVGEASQLRRTLDGLLEEDSNALFVVCGDFNDEQDSEAVKIVRGKGAGALKDFLSDLPEGAVTYSQDRFRSIIDFIFCSPAMGLRYVPKSYRVLDGSAESSGSDHNPVLIQLSLKEN